MKKILFWLSGVMIIVFLLTIGILEKSFSKEEHARHQALSLVSEFNVLKQVEEFYWYRGETQTYTLYGKNESNELIYIVIDVQKGMGQIYRDDEVVSYDTVMNRAMQLYPNAKFNSAVIGLEKQQLVWEITYRLNGQYSYIVFDAKTGSVLHEIKNATNE